MSLRPIVRSKPPAAKRLVIHRAVTAADEVVPAESEVDPANRPVVSDLRM
jgi:hypothetical protein